MENILSYFLCFFVEAVILLQYATILFLPRHSLMRRLTCLCISYISLFVLSFLNIKWLNMSLYLLVNFLFLRTQYFLKFRSSFFHSGILAAIMGMCELIVYSIIERFTPNFFAQMEDFHHTIIFIICSKILFFVTIYLLTHFLENQQKEEQQYDSNIFLLILVPITAIFIMLTFVAISDNYALTPFINWSISLSALFLLIINLLVFGVNQYNQKKSREYTEMQLLLQKETDFAEYYKMLLTQTENQSILIHDIKKHLQSISLLNEQRAFQKVNDYIQQLLLSSNLKETSRICSHELLNAILSRYSRQCDAKHIAFHTDIRNETVDFLHETDLTSLFCNLLENAMEAAQQTKEPFVEISTSKRENTPFILITLVNSCLTNPFVRRTNQLITSKADKQRHGFGIKSIRKIVQKYDGDIQMYYSSNSLTFHTVITLRKK